MTRLVLRKPGPSQTAAVRAGLAVSSLPEGEIARRLDWRRLQQIVKKLDQTFARGYGSAPAPPPTKPPPKGEGAENGPPKKPPGTPRAPRNRRARGRWIYGWKGAPPRR